MRMISKEWVMIADVLGSKRPNLSVEVFAEKVRSVRGWRERRGRTGFQAGPRNRNSENKDGCAARFRGLMPCATGDGLVQHTL